MTAITGNSGLSGRADRAPERDAQSPAGEQGGKLADLSARVEATTATMTEAAATSASHLTEFLQTADASAIVVEAPATRLRGDDPLFGYGLAGALSEPFAAEAPTDRPPPSVTVGIVSADIGQVPDNLVSRAGHVKAHPADVEISLTAAHPALLPTAPYTWPTVADRGVNGPDDFSERLTKGFAAAVKAAIQDAHTHGLAVSAYEDGIAIEVLPDGTKVPIDETVEWSPFAWRTRNLG